MSIESVLNYIKVGGVWYVNRDDVIRLLKNAKEADASLYRLREIIIQLESTKIAQEPYD